MDQSGCVIYHKNQIDNETVILINDGALETFKARTNNDFDEENHWHQTVKTRLAEVERTETSTTVWH